MTDINIFPDLYQKGVRNFVVNEIPEAASSYTDANFLIVPNPLKSLQRLASNTENNFRCRSLVSREVMERLW